MDRFFVVYEWIFQHPELSHFEAILVCYVLHFPKGCFESSNHIAKHLNTAPRVIKRYTKVLIQKGWLSCLYESNHRRILYATPKYPHPGPLFEQAEMQGKNRQKELSRQVRNLASGLAAKWAKKGE